MLNTLSAVWDWFKIIFGLLFFVVILFVCASEGASMIGETFVRIWLGASGTVGEATVIDSERISLNKSTDYFATFRYTTSDNQLHEVRVEVDTLLEENSVVSMRYLPDNPQVMRPESLISDGFGNFIGAVIGLLVVLTVIFVPIAIVVMVYYERQLDKYGQDLPGTVQKVETKSVIIRQRYKTRKEYRVVITYGFVSPNGVPLQGKETRQYSEAAARLPNPEIGTPVVVRYANDKLYRLSQILMHTQKDAYRVS